MFSTFAHTAVALLSIFEISQTSVTTSAHVEEPVGRSDVVCMAVAIHLGQNGDESVKEAANLLAMYYSGRAQVQLSEPALAEELRTVVPRISGDRWEIEKRRCGEGLDRAGEQLNRALGEVDAQIGGQ